MECYTEPFRDEELFCMRNKYDDLLACFVNACKFIELRTNNRKQAADLENEITFANSSRAIANLSRCIDAINLACNKIRTTNECLNRQSSPNQGEYIEIPYSMQLETVQSLKDVYNLPFECEKYRENEQFLESSGKAANALIRTIKSNIGELESFQILKSIKL